MPKAKTTVYVDHDLLRSARVYAARHDMKDSEVIELGLRKVLGRDVLEEIWERNVDVDPDAAEAAAYQEKRAARGR